MNRRPLLGLAEWAWATQAADHPRALDAAELARVCRRLGARAQAEADVEAALNAGVADAQQAAQVIVCVTGSLLLVGQARSALGVPVAERLW